MAGRMRDVSHTHPETGETFGGSRAYHRGPAVTDGGRAPEAEAEADTDDAGSVDAATMADVDHTPPHDGGDRGFWARGFRAVPGDGAAPTDGDATAPTGEGTEDDNE